jgi:Skp family chaperone for outer membrane proteins
MKNEKIISLLFAACVSVAACNNKIDEAKIPAVVKETFAKDFPGISAKWDKENVDFEASFKMNDKTMSALYDDNGIRKETETDIKVDDLPASVKSYINDNYKGEKIKEAAIITKANGEINYEAEVSDLDVLFTKDGFFIKSEKE